MSRSISASNQAVLADPFRIEVYFAQMVFDDGTVYVHNDLGTITFGGNDYLGMAQFGRVSKLQESEGTAPIGIELSLSGVDSTFLNEARAQHCGGRPIYLYKGFRNTITGAMVDDPDAIFIGSMQKMLISSGAGQLSVVTVQCEDHRRRFKKAPLHYYDNDTLQTEHTGDTFFKYLTSMQNLQLKWGNDFAVALGKQS